MFCSNRAMLQDPDFPISHKHIPGIPSEEGPEKERAILFHTILDAAVYPYLNPSAAQENKPLLVLSFPDEDVVKELLPRNAFKREEAPPKKKKPKFLLHPFPKSDKENATHFEEALRWRDKESSGTILQVLNYLGILSI